MFQVSEEAVIPLDELRDIGKGLQVYLREVESERDPAKRVEYDSVGRQCPIKNTLFANLPRKSAENFDTLIICYCLRILLASSA